MDPLMHGALRLLESPLLAIVLVVGGWLMGGDWRVRGRRSRHREGGVPEGRGFAAVVDRQDDRFLRPGASPSPSVS